MNYVLAWLKNFRFKRKHHRLESKQVGEKNEYFNFKLIGKYYYNFIENNSKLHIISDKVSNDLDIDEVFAFIDRTSSKIGQQFLYCKLRTVENIKRVQYFDKLINVFESQQRKAEKTQGLLSKLNKDYFYFFEELIHQEQIEKPKWINLVYFLSVISLVSLISAFFNPNFIFVSLSVFIINLFLHYQNKAKINYYMVAISGFYKSAKTAKLLLKDSEIKNHFTDLSFLNKIKNIQNKAKFISFEKQLSNNEFTVFLWAFLELVKILFNIEIIIFFSFIDEITKERNNIGKLFSFIGEIDAAISVAILRSEELPTCKPIFTNDKRITLENIIHPLVQNCVPNSLELNNKSLLLTGSNMSGKTTFIRTVSVNAILAQTIYTCFAEKYDAPFFRIFSSIRVSDNLLKNTSYFLEEVIAIKEFLNASKDDESCLFVLDEIFKGTNTAERISAGNAILSFLNKKNHFILVSTHDIELTELLKNDNYELYHFQEQIVNGRLFFDHKIKNGKLKTRNAIKILELYNYPHEIIDHANLTLNLFEKTGTNEKY